MRCLRVILVVELEPASPLHPSRRKKDDDEQIMRREQVRVLAQGSRDVYFEVSSQGRVINNNSAIFLNVASEGEHGNRAARVYLDVLGVLKVGVV